MEAVSSLYLKPFLCKLGLKCDFQNWTFPPMSNNLSCKNTLLTQKLFFYYKERHIYSFPVLEVLDAPYWIGRQRLLCIRPNCYNIQLCFDFSMLSFTRFRNQVANWFVAVDCAVVVVQIQRNLMTASARMRISRVQIMVIKWPPKVNDYKGLPAWASAEFDQW